MTWGARSASGCVVCPEPPASEVGRDVLARGGNAADAAVGAAFAQAVTNPLECGIGGTALIHLYDAKSARTAIINAGVTIGSRPIPEDWADQTVGRAETVGPYLLRTKANQIGYGSIMTPGFVRGCWAVLEKFGSGRFSWRELIAPAIEYAKRGFTIYPHAAWVWRSRDMYPGSDLIDTLHATTEATRLFLKPDGSVYQEGDALRQPDLADTLERIATAGADDFYSGEIGEVIAADLAEHGAFVTAEDMRNYAAVDMAPLVARYRGVDIATTSSPATGPRLLQMLKILEHFDLVSLGHNSVDYVKTFARIQRASFADGGIMKGMDGHDASLLEERLLDPERALHWATRIKDGDPIRVQGGSVPPGTTHLVVVDGARNVVSFTHSVGELGGAGVVTEGLGFLYNGLLLGYNPVPGHPNSIAPGKRLGGGLPTIIFEQGRPYIAIGAPGGSRLLTSTAQVIVNLIDHRFDMSTAVTAPRLHSEQERVIILEPSFPRSTTEALTTAGETVRRSSYMSRVQAIRIGADGELEAAPDPRGGSVSFHVSDG
jgi:gamma-glutamyltranspeptidase/glutathione hydrolase